MADKESGKMGRKEKWEGRTGLFRPSMSATACNNIIIIL